MACRVTKLKVVIWGEYLKGLTADTSPIMHIMSKCIQWSHKCTVNIIYDNSIHLDITVVPKMTPFMHEDV